MTSAPPSTSASRAAIRRGFTLVELLIVMTIIGIIVTMILVASRDGIRQAELRATQALILKLESGLNDRLDALEQLRPEPNFAHAYLAGVYLAGYSEADGGPRMNPSALLLNTGYPDPAVRTSARAQAFALADYLKSEIPDVFFVQSIPSGSDANAYPLNFAAHPSPGDPIDASRLGSALYAHASYVLPLGHLIQGPRTSTGLWTSGFGDGHFRQNPTSGSWLFESSNPRLGLTGRGIYGASYSAAAGLYKNLGYLPAGYDLVDNDGDGLIDEWDEGVKGADGTDVSADVVSRLGAHTHETARAEMLYALLVEGQGPLGSSFNADDFSDREVKDTDGDGLPEFVDAWGKPLQFFRWPTLYHSDAQRGQVVAVDPVKADGIARFQRPYASSFDAREQDPLDPNQSLMSPSWWLDGYNGGYPDFDPSTIVASGAPINSSRGVAAFQRFFHRLTEPVEYRLDTSSDRGRYWDRGGMAGLGYRRAFFTKALILSGGPDQRAGVLLATSLPTGVEAASTMLISVENNALQFVPPSGLISADLAVPLPDASVIDAPENPQTFYLLDHGQDDVTNHTVTATAGSGG